MYIGISPQNGLKHEESSQKILESDEGVHVRGRSPVPGQNWMRSEETGPPNGSFR